MTVWIVLRRYDYEGDDVDRVFSTEEKALRYVAQEASKGTSSAKLVIQEWQVDL